MNEQTGVKLRGFKTEFLHSVSEVLIEQQGTVRLTIETLVQLENHISCGGSLGMVALWKFHVDWALLGTLAKGQGEVNLARVPSMSGCKQQGSSDGQPTNKRRIRISFLLR